jgi:hypothetical protein
MIKGFVGIEMKKEFLFMKKSGTRHTSMHPAKARGKGRPSGFAIVRGANITKPKTHGQPHGKKDRKSADKGWQSI